MPRRIPSDTDFSPPSKPRKKPKPSTTKTKASKGKAGKGKARETETVISAWARRRAVDVDVDVVSEDVIDDVDIDTPKATRASVLRGINVEGFTGVHGDLRTSLFDEIDKVPSVSELAVHKRKVTEVSTWLQEFPQHRKKLLVLSGPAGSGKSTTILSLAKESGIQVVEWINPVDESKLTTLNEDIESLSRKFSTFLLHSQRYGSLDTTSPNSKQLILIQDLPNTIGSSAVISQSRSIFQSSLKQILVSPRAQYPVILVITESEIGNGGEDFGYSAGFRHEGLSVKSVVGDEILAHPATTHITFNPVARTIMMKSLMSMCALKPLGKEVLQRIVDSAAGDIRSALNCASLVATQIQQNSKKKSDPKLLAGLECREGGLDLFHAAGRVVYNKRYGDDPEDPPMSPGPSLPPHLTDFTRRKSKVNIDDLLTSAQTDTSTLRSLIHQNYPLSCSLPDHIDDIATILSDTDFLFPPIHLPNNTQAQLAAYYMLSGVLMGLPSPVERDKRDNVMKWPDSTRLPKRIREIQQRLEGITRSLGVTGGKREEMVLDLLPLWGVIGGDEIRNVRREIKEVCEFPLRGRGRVMDPYGMDDLDFEDVDTVGSGAGATGGGGKLGRGEMNWVVEDDIEDD